MNIATLKINNQGGVYASIVRQLQSICSSQRRLFGSPVIDSIEDLFDAIDINKDGNLSVDEMWKGLKRLDLGLSREQVEDLVVDVDVVFYWNVKS